MKVSIYTILGAIIGLYSIAFLGNLMRIATALESIAKHFSP
jgi:hypothetical protein